ncbi:hypothetical protein [Streptomyces polygonati]
MTGHVLRALRGTAEHSGLAVHVAQAADTKAALAAVRVLGPDVFAPALLASAPFGPDDQEVVAEALRVFPPSPEDAPETAGLGWATGTLLARFGGEVLAVRDLRDVAGYEPAGAAERVPAARDTGPVASCAHWRDWSRSMARLAPLALPGLEGPAHQQARRRTLALSRGVVRSMLRRDYPTAARLIRWAALARGGDLPASLDIATLVTHLELCGAGGSRTALNTTIARLLLSEQPEPEERAA